MKKLISLVFLILSILTAFNFKIQASDIINLSPDSIRVGETDIGRTYTIVITNNSNNKLKLKATEVRLKYDNGQLVKDDSELQTTALEIFVDEFDIEPQDTYEHKFRVKFTSLDFELIFPGIEYTNIDNSSDVFISYEKSVPIYIQSKQGDYTVDLTLELEHENITNDPNILIQGSIHNTGDKFFEGSLLLNIYKNNEIVLEQDLTNQIKGIIFKGGSKEFEHNYVIENTSFKDFAEYKVEVKLNNDINSNTKVASINIFFLPTETIYIVGGILLALIFIIISIFSFKKNNKYNKA